MKVLVFALSLLMSATTVASRYRCATFNVWGDGLGNPPKERDAQQALLLKGMAPHFISLQEVTAGFCASRLIVHLENNFVVIGRKMGPGGCDAQTPLLFKKGRFELLEKGSRWFHPDLDNSKGVVWAAVRDINTGEKIVSFSSQFWSRKDGEGDDYVRLQDARMLYDEVSAAAERHSAAVIGGGDLNAGLASPALVELVRLGWRDAQDTTPGRDTRPTWHGFPVRGSDGALHGVTFDKVTRPQRRDHFL